MSRYVDLDEEIKAMYFDEEHEEWNLKEETIESALNHVDCYSVFELIRCKDCEFYESSIALDRQGYCWYQNTRGFLRNDDDFCSRAERVEE